MTDGGGRWVGGASEWWWQQRPTGVLEGVDLHVQQWEGLSEVVGHRRLLLLKDLGHLMIRSIKLLFTPFIPSSVDSAE